MEFQSIGNLGGWTLKMFTYNSSTDELWGVGSSGNLGKMKNKAKQLWIEVNQPWQMNMVAFDSEEVMWGVGTAGNVGKWDETNNTWIDQGKLGGWTLKMITFDLDGNMWCVGTASNVGKWDETNNTWIDYGKLGGWTMDWIQFRPGDVNEMYCIGTANNLGKYEFDTKDMLNVPCNWSLLSIDFTDEITAAVGTEGNVGVDQSNY